MTARETLRKFIKDMEDWTFEVFDLRTPIDVVTKKKIDRWIRELRVLYYGGMLNLNMKATNDSLSMLGVTAKAFEEEFRKKVIALSKTDFAKATILERSLKSKFKGDKWQKFYRDYDEIVRNYPSRSLREVQKLFLKKTSILKFQDKNGNAWQPKTYASMYARTRSSEVANSLMIAEMDNQGMNIVQVTDANTTTPICLLHEDRYYSLDGKDLPKLPYYAPFHPNCRHRIVPRTNRGIEKYKVHNRKLDARLKGLQSGWTNGDWKSISRQEKWLYANQPV
jgi:hypothetical protein